MGASNPGKLANDLNGYNKKNKLGLKGLSPEVVGAWLSNAKQKNIRIQLSNRKEMLIPNKPTKYQKELLEDYVSQALGLNVKITSDDAISTDKFEEIKNKFPFDD